MGFTKKGLSFLHLLIFLSSFIPTHGICQEMMLLRSANTLPQSKILVWESLFFAHFAKKFDFDKEAFVRLTGDNYSFTSYTMLGYAVLDNLELLVQLPIHTKVSTQPEEKSSSTGIGDISLQTRLMLHDGSDKCPAINIGVMARWPTGNHKKKPPLGDGTMDLGFSTVITKKFGFFAGHIKLGYIFQGSNHDGTDLGDKFLYLLKTDFTVISGDYPAIKDLTLMLGLNGYLKFEDMDQYGDSIENSRQLRPLNIVPMIRWTPLEGLFIRPKAVIPIEPVARGGKYFIAQYVLDIKYSF